MVETKSGAIPPNEDSNKEAEIEKRLKDEKYGKIVKIIGVLEGPLQKYTAYLSGLKVSAASSAEAKKLSEIKSHLYYMVVACYEELRLIRGFLGYSITNETDFKNLSV